MLSSVRDTEELVQTMPSRERRDSHRAGASAKRPAIVQGVRQLPLHSRCPPQRSARARCPMVHILFQRMVVINVGHMHCCGWVVAGLLWCGAYCVVAVRRPCGGLVVAVVWPCGGRRRGRAVGVIVIVK